MNIIEPALEALRTTGYALSAETGEDGAPSNLTIVAPTGKKVVNANREDIAALLGAARTIPGVGGFIALIAGASGGAK